ncbi:MAG: hypothetical protein LBI77_01720 [Puniceicoccales bacterium]|jgi:ankyrin repeat protein|nr:hypothetical protein [Puniceicoccales bacterium]
MKNLRKNIVCLLVGFTVSTAEVIGSANKNVGTVGNAQKQRNSLPVSSVSRKSQLRKPPKNQENWFIRFFKNCQAQTLENKKPSLETIVARISENSRSYPSNFKKLMKNFPTLNADEKSAALIAAMILKKEEDVVSALNNLPKSCLEFNWYSDAIFNVSPAQAAVLLNEKNFLKIFLEHGADVNDYDQRDCVLATLAVQRGNFEMLSFILDQDDSLKGLKFPDVQKKTTLDYARKKKNQKMISLIENKLKEEKDASKEEEEEEEEEEEDTSTLEYVSAQVSTEEEDSVKNEPAKDGDKKDKLDEKKEK